MKNKIFVLGILLVFSKLGFSQIVFDKVKLDNYFNALEQNNKFMGSVAVSKNGEIIYQKSIGFADVEAKVKATEKTKYRIGSISKSFTAVLVFKAIEDKKLELNQSIGKWWPTFTNANKVTISHLLNHRSGIHNFTNDKDYLTWNTEAKTEGQMIEIIKKGGFDFEPDTKGEYSNSNYVLLTYILEKIYKQPYSKLLQNYIVKTVGLEDTYVFGIINTGNNEAKSYHFDNNSWEIEKETNFTIPMGAGAIISTPIDLTKFSEALFSGKLLKPESLVMMKTIKDNFGNGLMKIPFYEHISYGHTGGIDGFSSVYSYFPEDKISFALTSNGSNYNNNNISIALLSAIFDKPYETPNFSVYEVNTEDLDKYLGVYASKDIPLKITISKEGNTLIAQATGQSSFPLEAKDKNKFEFDGAGIKLEFNPDQKSMLLLQNGGKFEFTRE